MSKVQHYRTDLVIARTEFGPIVKMMKAIAERRHFQFNHELDYISKRGPRMKVQPIMNILNELEKPNHDIIIAEFQRLNTIAFTKKMATTILRLLENHGVEIPPEIRSASISGKAAWAYAMLPEKAWHQICSLTQVAQIARNSWTTVNLLNIPEDFQIDTSDEMQERIKSGICEFISKTEGRAEAGFCGHYYDEDNNEDCFTLSMTDHPILKTIHVTKSRFRERPFKDVFQIVFRYNRTTHELHVCSDGNETFDKHLCNVWAKTIFPEADDIEIVIPNTDTYNLEFIKYRSGNLPIPEGSHIKSATVVSARTQVTTNSRKWFALHLDGHEDLHESLLNTWKANHVEPIEMSIKRIEIDFVYQDPMGERQTLRYFFSQSTSDYQSAPADAVISIRDILLDIGIIREAA